MARTKQKHKHNNKYHVRDIKLSSDTQFLPTFSRSEVCQNSYFIRSLKISWNQLKHSFCTMFGLTDKMAAAVDDRLKSVCEKFNIEKLNDVQI